MARTPTPKAKSKASAATPTAETDRSIAENLPKLVETLLNIAVGIKIEKDTADGKQVYTQPPNRMAAEYLINRVLGKPAERIQTDGADIAFEELDWELKDLRNLTPDELIRLHRKTIGEA